MTASRLGWLGKIDQSTLWFKRARDAEKRAEAYQYMLGALVARYGTEGVIVVLDADFQAAKRGSLRAEYDKEKQATRLVFKATEKQDGASKDKD